MPLKWAFCPGIEGALDASMLAREGRTNTRVWLGPVQARQHLDADETPSCSVLGTYETKRLGSDSVRSGI